jgi:hypothetical protein
VPRHPSAAFVDFLSRRICSWIDSRAYCDTNGPSERPTSPVIVDVHKDPRVQAETRMPGTARERNRRAAELLASIRRHQPRHATRRPVSSDHESETS